MKRRLFIEGPFEEELPAGPDPFALGWRLRAFGSNAVWAFEARVLRPADSDEPPLSPFRADYESERRRACAFIVLADTATIAKLLLLWVPDALARPFRRWFHPDGSFWGTLFGMLSICWTVGRLGKAGERMQVGRTLPDGGVTSQLSSRIVMGNGIFAGLWNAFCAAYLAAVGLPTRETLDTPSDKTRSPSA
jgi:hypothetical protein